MKKEIKPHLDVIVDTIRYCLYDIRNKPTIEKLADCLSTIKPHYDTENVYAKEIKDTLPTHQLIMIAESYAYLGTKYNRKFTDILPLIKKLKLLYY